MRYRRGDRYLITSFPKDNRLIPGNLLTTVNNKSILKYILLDKDNRLVVAKGRRVGEGLTGSLGLADANWYIQDG